MKRMMILLCVVTMLWGCSGRQVEDRMDAVGDKVESGLESIMGNKEGAPNPDLSVEEAKSIAFNHANTTEDQVTGLRTEYEVDDGVGHYDVRFWLEGMEYEYEIHGNTGKIISFEKDS